MEYQNQHPYEPNLAAGAVPQPPLSRAHTGPQAAAAGPAPFYRPDEHISSGSIALEIESAVSQADDGAAYLDSILSQISNEQEVVVRDPREMLQSDDDFFNSVFDMDAFEREAERRAEQAALFERRQAEQARRSQLEAQLSEVQAEAEQRADAEMGAQGIAADVQAPTDEPAQAPMEEPTQVQADEAPDAFEGAAAESEAAPDTAGAPAEPEPAEQPEETEDVLVGLMMDQLAGDDSQPGGAATDAYIEVPAERRDAAKESAEPDIIEIIEEPQAPRTPPASAAEESGPSEPAAVNADGDIVEPLDGLDFSYEPGEEESIFGVDPNELMRRAYEIGVKVMADRQESGEPAAPEAETEEPQPAVMPEAEPTEGGGSAEMDDVLPPAEGGETAEPLEPAAEPPEADSGETLAGEDGAQENNEAESDPRYAAKQYLREKERLAEERRASAEIPIVRPDERPEAEPAEPAADVPQEEESCIAEGNIFPDDVGLDEYGEWYVSRVKAPDIRPAIVGEGLGCDLHYEDKKGHKHCVLSEASFSIGHGSITAVVSKRRYDSYTLLSVLGGTVQMSSGSFTIDGVATGPNEMVEMPNRLYLDGAPLFDPSMTVRDAIGFATALAAEEKADELLAACGMEEQADAAIRSLTMPQKIALYIVSVLPAGIVDTILVNAPELSLRGGDRDALVGALQLCRTRGITVVLGVSGSEWIDDVVDSVVLLNAGRVSYNGPVSSLCCSVSNILLAAKAPCGAAVKQAVEEAMPGLTVEIGDDGFIIAGGGSMVDAPALEKLLTGLEVPYDGIVARPLCFAAAVKEVFGDE